MAIARWRPTNDLAGLHSAMDRLFGDMFGDATFNTPQLTGDGNGGRTQTLPTFHLPVDIMETESGYRIQAPVPGFRPEDVEVTFSDGVLTINAQRSEEKRDEKADYLRREVAYGHYRRQIALPGDVKAEEIKARFDDGMLTIEVPRAPKPQPAKIEVQRGQRSGAAESKQVAGSGARHRS